MFHSTRQFHSSIFLSLDSRYNWPYLVNGNRDSFIIMVIVKKILNIVCLCVCVSLFWFCRIQMKTPNGMTFFVRRESFPKRRRGSPKMTSLRWWNRPLRTNKNRVIFYFDERTAFGNVSLIFKKKKLNFSHRRKGTVRTRFGWPRRTGGFGRWSDSAGVP